MDRIKHRELLNKVREMGYEIYTMDYSQQDHVYQAEKGSEWNEWEVKKIKGEKIISIFGVDNEELANLIRSYYENQGFRVVADE